MAFVVGKKLTQAVRTFALLGSAVLGMAALFTASAAAEEALPVELDEYGRMTVPIMLGEGAEERRFLFDTAARRSLLLNQDSNQVGLKRYEKGTIRHFSSAGLVRLPVARFEAWQLGDRVLKNSIVGFYPDSASGEGLLGNGAFWGRIVHWVPGASELRVYPNASKVSNAAWHNLGGKPNRHYGMLLRTEYRGIEIDILVATGASRTLLSSDSAQLLLPDYDWRSAKKRHVSAARGLGFDSKDYTVLRLPEFSIGKWDLGTLNVGLARFDLQETTGFRNANLLVLGADMLTKHEVAYDFRDFQLWYKNPEVGEGEKVADAAGE